MISPFQAFLQWFEHLPVVVKKGLAHLFVVCTTEDANLMTDNNEDGLVRFGLWVRKGDFPLRVTAKVFYVRSVFDLVILHHKEILKEKCVGMSGVIPLSDHQWEKVADTWIKLRNKELSDAYVHSWASHVIGFGAGGVC